jgi:hypothetical protein
VSVVDNAQEAKHGQNINKGFNQVDSLQSEIREYKEIISSQNTELLECYRQIVILRNNR